MASDTGLSVVLVFQVLLIKRGQRLWHQSVYVERLIIFHLFKTTFIFKNILIIFFSSPRPLTSSPSPYPPNLMVVLTKQTKAQNHNSPPPNIYLGFLSEQTSGFLIPVPSLRLFSFCWFVLFSSKRLILSSWTELTSFWVHFFPCSFAGEDVRNLCRDSFMNSDVKTVLITRPKAPPPDTLETRIAIHIFK